MDTIIPPEIAAHIPASTLSLFNTSVLIVFILGRVYHTVVNGGGIYGIYTALVYGKTTPKAITTEPDKTDPK